MARPSRDLSKFQALLLFGGSAAFLILIIAAGLVSIALAATDESRVRKERDRLAEVQPPSELLKVPEVVIESIPPNANQARVQIAQLVQKIRIADSKAPEGFVNGLIKDRHDLQGLPFIMGAQCRMENGAATTFGMAVNMTHASLRAEGSSVFTNVDSVELFYKGWNGQDPGAGVAALTQILGPQGHGRRESLAKHLKAIDHPSSTRALARAAVFDFDPQVRTVALEGLRKRSKQDYTDVLMAALRHPWTAAAHNAARAIYRLDRQDLLPELVAFLAEADPRAPFEKPIDGQPAMVVREMVKVNHHKNCLLCHPPLQQNTMPGGVFGVVPTPGVAFAPPDSGGPYQGSPGDPMVRADVTYLRQDFSVLLAVANAHPWPDMQRFDFMVRTRVLDADEIARHLELKKAGAPAELSENHKAALQALRRLTGQDAGLTAAAWAQLLDLPMPQVAKQ